MDTRTSGGRGSCPARRGSNSGVLPRLRSGQLLPAAGEPLHVAHQPGRLEHEPELGTRRGGPPQVGVLPRGAVERHVELDDAELALVELESPLARQLRWVEHPPPAVVREAAGPDQPGGHGPIVAARTRPGAGVHSVGEAETVRRTPPSALPAGLGEEARVDPLHFVFLALRARGRFPLLPLRDAHDLLELLPASAALEDVGRHTAPPRLERLACNGWAVRPPPPVLSFRSAVHWSSRFPRPPPGSPVKIASRPGNDKRGPP